MRLGIGGRREPVRFGDGPPGVDGGVAPLHEGARGRRRKNLRRSLLISYLIGFAIVLVWPYLAGTWLAVQLGASRSSLMRSTVGWTFEAMYVMGVVLWLSSREASTARSRAARLARENMQSLVRSAQASHDLIRSMCTAPAGVADPNLPATHRLLAVFEEAILIEPRAAYRGGPRVPTGVAGGTARVTDHGVTFVSPARSTQWRYDKVADSVRGPDYVTFHVSNRQIVSGVSVGADRQDAFLTAIDWGMNLATNHDLGDVLTRALSLEQADAAALAQVRIQASTIDSTPVTDKRTAR